MKTKLIKEADHLAKMQEPALLTLVLSNLKGVVLFPERIEAAKEYLRQRNKKATV